MAKMDFGALSASKAAEEPKTAKQTQQVVENTETKAKRGKGKKDIFSVWADPEQVRRWKNYQLAKKNTYPTQADFVTAALNQFIEQNPVTPEEKQALLDQFKI